MAKAIAVLPTTNVRISAAAPAHQTTSGPPGKAHVQIALEPEPDAEWRRIFKTQKGIDRWMLPTTGSLMLIGYDTLADLQKKMPAIKFAIEETNDQYREEIEKGDAAKEQADAELAEVVEYLLKEFPPKS